MVNWSYLIDYIGGRVEVILGDLQAVEDSAIVVGAKGGDLDGVSRGEEGGPPIIDEAFINYDKPFYIVKFLAGGFIMQ